MRAIEMLPLDRDVADPGSLSREVDDRLESLQRLLPALGTTDRRILGMLLVAGASEADVARRLGMNVAAVRQRKCRLVRKLAALVER